MNIGDDKNTSQTSTSETGSSAGNYVDIFTLLEVRENVSGTMKKFNAIVTFVAGLNAKIDDMVSGLDSKIDSILKSLSETKKSGPTVTEREAQLDQLISRLLKHTIEEVEQKYDASVDHYLDTITKMLNVLDDLVSATNELIKQTHFHHEKKIQRLESQI